MKSDINSLFKSNGPGSGTTVNKGNLKILVVDDEPTVHDITALVLKSFRYKGYGLAIHSAYSASEAREILADHGPFALILLDVIMETDNAGLELARYIRDELNDHMVRIILRTGQPGMVPQRKVMREFEIDDYKEKAELTSERFDATVTASLRTYLGIQKLEQSRQGLLTILDAIKDMDDPQCCTNPESLGDRILRQLGSVMKQGESRFSNALVASQDKTGKTRIVAGDGVMSDWKNQCLEDLEDRDLVSRLRSGLSEGSTVYDGKRLMTSLLTRDGGRYLAYFDDLSDFGEVEQYLVELYASHVNVSLDNRILNRELLDTQKEIISTLGEVIESRSGETAHHVRRVGELARLIGETVGMDSHHQEMLLFAAPLHDIGKVGIPDSILEKPGALSPEEFAVMKNHAYIGWEILQGSQRPVLQLGARICLEHHEWWDGSGYPKGLRGREISLEARICALADVFDALRSKRIYKEAMSFDETVQIIRNERETHFDPELTDALLSRSNDIRKLYTDLPIY